MGLANVHCGATPPSLMVLFFGDVTNFSQIISTNRGSIRNLILFGKIPTIKSKIGIQLSQIVCCYIPMPLAQNTTDLDLDLDLRYYGTSLR